jgi:hypothetical protein
LVTLRQNIQTVFTSKKVTLKSLQSLIGLQNFACKTVASDRAFCRRLFDGTFGIKKPYHMIRVNKGMKQDLSVWIPFLEHFNGVPIITSGIRSLDNALQLFTDSAAGPTEGSEFRCWWLDPFQVASQLGDI